MHGLDCVVDLLTQVADARGDMHMVDPNDICILLRGLAEDIRPALYD